MRIPDLFGQLEAAAGGRYRFIASTESKDSYSRVIRAAGWQLDEFRANPVMLWDHGHSSALEREPIGQVPVVAVESYRGRPALIAEAEPAPVLSPVAERLWKQVDAGTIRAVSIGARPTKPPEYHFDQAGNLDFTEYTGQKLIELSLVSVGANPDALRIAASAFGRDFAAVFGPLAVRAAFSADQRPDPSHRSKGADWRRRERLATL